MNAELDFDEKQRIMNDVTMGFPDPADESEERKAWRKRCKRDAHIAQVTGLTMMPIKE